MSDTLHAVLIQKSVAPTEEEAFTRYEKLAPFILENPPQLTEDVEIIERRHSWELIFTDADELVRGSIITTVPEFTRRVRGEVVVGRRKQTVSQMVIVAVEGAPGGKAAVEQEREIEVPIMEERVMSIPGPIRIRGIVNPVKTVFGKKAS